MIKFNNSKGAVVNNKTWFRCTVCEDIHYGMTGPRVCPTCQAENAYIKVSPIEAKAAQEIVTDPEEIKKNAVETSKQQLRELFDAFTKSKEYELNQDEEHLSLTLDGVLKNEKDTGLKYCPCQLRTDDLSHNLTLLCPCNFTAQENYGKEGRCWCGLFTKRG